MQTEPPALDSATEPLAEQFVTLLRQCLGIPTAVSLHVDARVPSPGRPPVLRVHIGEKYWLHLSDVDAQPVHDGAYGGLALRWNSGPLGTESFVPNDLRASVQRRMAYLTTQPRNAVAKLAELVGSSLTLLSMQDLLFRKLSGTTEGTYGLLRVSFQCNQDCAFCWQGRDWPAVDPAWYFLWAEQMAARGARDMLITGGEPTLWPDLPRLVATCTALGMRVTVETNAIRLRQPHVLGPLQEAGLSVAFVSYHSHVAAISDHMTRAPKTHKNTELGIRAALEAGLEVQLNCVVQADNGRDLVAYAHAIVERFVTPYPRNPVSLVSFSQPMPFHDVGLFEDALLPLDELNAPLAEAARVLRGAGVRVQVDGTCGFPLCIARDEPGLMHWQDGQNVDESDKIARGYADACRSCAARDGCLGVRLAYLERWGDRGLRPFAVLPPGLKPGT